MCPELPDGSQLHCSAPELHQVGPALLETHLCPPECQEELEKQVVPAMEEMDASSCKDRSRHRLNQCAGSRDGSRYGLDQYTGGCGGDRCGLDQYASSGKDRSRYGLNQCTGSRGGSHDGRRYGLD